MSRIPLNTQEKEVMSMSKRNKTIKKIDIVEIGLYVLLILANISQIIGLILIVVNYNKNIDTSVTAEKSIEVEELEWKKHLLV